MQKRQPTVYDFVLDERFQAWVLEPTPESIQYWQRFQDESPEMKPVMDEAKRLILLFGFHEKDLSESEAQRILGNIKVGIRTPSSTNPQEQAPIKSPGKYLWLPRIAATITGILFLTCIGWYVIRSDNQTAFQTTYGEIREVMLPDSSLVTLNGNSNLSFSNQWKTGHLREVWLEGEAYFQVRPSDITGQATPDISDESVPDEYKFIVHTRGVDVVVLGTRFNVNSRQENVKVVLESGRVKLDRQSGLSGMDAVEDEVLMEPGEMVMYEVEDMTFSKKIVNPEIYSSWRNHYLILNEISLQEVAAIIESTYGMKVTFQEPELSDYKIKGTVPSNDIQVLFNALSDGFGITVTQQGNTILLSKKQPDSP
ncbi:MAG: FecR domain-containing protein [Cyclobacteriaceae bacterium]